MKTTPIAGPLQVQGTNQGAEAAAKAKAVAAFNQSQQAQSAPIPVDANAVSVEELGAIRQNPSIEAEVPETIEETVVEPKEDLDPQLSSKLAQLARREKSLRIKAQQQDQQLKAERQQFEADKARIRAEIEAEVKSQYIPKSRFKSATLDVLAEEGVSYEDLTQQEIVRQSMDPATKAYIQRMEARVAAVEARNEEAQKAVELQSQAQYQAAVKQIRSDVDALVSADPEFEVVRATNSQRDVVELIEETFKQTGNLITVEEAAQKVEEYLVSEASKLSKIAKIQKRLTPASTAAQSVQKQIPEKPKQTQPVKTLTNAIASTRQLSVKERAILAFKGELKD